MNRRTQYQESFRLGTTEYNIPVVLVEIYPGNKMDDLHFQAAKRNVIPINEGPMIVQEVAGRSGRFPRPPFLQSATFMVDEVTLTSDECPIVFKMRNAEIFITESWMTITDVDSCGTRVWYFVRKEQT